jgi:hypothetical protein
MYDLILFPIYQQQGKPQPNGPGFRAASPPRRAARSRSDDLLVVSLFTKGGSDRLSPALLDSWLANLVQDFFMTGGSVTSALRALIEALNLTMMEKNLKSAQEGAAITGAINLAAVHRRSVYIVQSGLTHAYTLSQSGLAHFYDTSQTDRGLGLSRTPTIRYYQADLDDGAYLFLTDNPPATWTEDQLQFGGFPKIEQLRRRLLNQTSPNFRLDLVQIVPGEGQIKTVQASSPLPGKAEWDEPVLVDSAPLKPPSEVIEPETEPTPVDISDTQKIPPDTGAVESLEAEDESAAITPTEPPAEQDMAEARPAVDEKPLPAGEDEPVAGTVEEVTEKPAKPMRETTPKVRQSFSETVDILRVGGLKGLAIFFDWWRKFWGDVGVFFKNTFSRLGLIGDEGLAELSNRTLFLIAAAVPLVVVAIAVGIYLGRGRTLQYQYYQEQAELAAMRAYSAEESALARDAWIETMLFLDQAESLRRTDEAAQLRAEAQRAIDALDGAVRLAYHPAIIGTLHDQILITRMISYGLDLYLLDSAGGRVIHAIRASQGYQVDADFVCGAGNFSGGAVDALVDMVSLPINNPYQAHILAVDALGQVIYCGPGIKPVVQTLPRGDVGVGAVTRLASDGNLLYVLDPSAEAVSVYRSTNGQFLDTPSDFFAGADEGQKPSIAPIVDLAVNGAEMYLLRGDGMLVHCVASGLPGNPVTCDNPVDYVDGRPGQEDQAVVMPGSTFVSVLFTPPPEPAVNILDGENADIFRFSLRFRLHQRLRSDFGQYEIAEPTATAFTIGVDRIAFMAFGHQVFFAYVE